VYSPLGRNTADRRCSRRVACRCGGWSVAPIDECNTWGKVVICLGDYQAVKSGGIGKRVPNKLIDRNVVRRLWG
jgi:hypothetical protein